MVGKPVLQSALFCGGAPLSFLLRLISIDVNHFPLSTDSVSPCYAKGANLWHRRVSVAKQAAGVSRGKPKAPNSQELPGKPGSSGGKNGFSLGCSLTPEETAAGGKFSTV